jgi:hypothetical protein
LLLSLVLVGTWTTGAPGIDLEFVLNPGTELPSFDSDASALMGMFDIAESFYEDAFEDVDFSVTVDVGYAPLPGLLGFYNGTAISIRLASDRSDWFVDPTPNEHSEFGIEQVLWRDLTDSQKANLYNDFGDPDNIPDTFEVAIRGDSGPEGTYDMLTVMFHEVGHALGMSQLTILETLDGDYDFDPEWVFGSNLAAETASALGIDNLNVGHLKNPDAVMGVSLDAATRRLPSHTDLFSMASGLQLEDLDVPRREFYGNSNWQNDANWSGHAEPDAADEVFVRAAQGSGIGLTAGLTANGAAGSLHVAEGANVDTNGFKLDVTGDVDVSDPDSDIFIDPGGELEARDVSIRNEAEIEMSAGTLDVRRLSTTGDGQLESIAGASSIVIAELLDNRGEIDANGNSTMSFNSGAANPWDLDGSSENGRVDATEGNIFFLSGGLADEFHGTMIIGGGHTLSIPEAWSLSSLFIPFGTLQFNSDGILAGGNLTMSGELNVTGGTAQIQPPMTMNNGAIHIEGSSTLQLSGQADYQSGMIQIDAGGSLVMNGSAEFGVATTSTNDGEMIFNGTATLDRGTFQGAGTYVFNSTATISTSADLDIADMEIGTGGDLTAIDNITINVAGITTIHGGGHLTTSGASLNTTNLTANSGSFVTLNSGAINIENLNKAANATLELAGGILTISGGDAAFNSSFIFGGAGNPIARIEDGADAVVTFAWRMATGAGESGTTIVTGTGGGRRSTLRGTGGGAGADLVVGLSGDAALLVSQGGLASFRDDFVIAQNAGSVGQATIIGVQDGFRSTVDVTGSAGNSSVQIGGGDGGGAAAAILRIQAGALVQSSGDVLMARYTGEESIAFLEIGGMAGGFPAELVVADDIFVGGTGTTAGGTATVTLDAGGVIRGDEMIVWGGGTVEMNGGDMTLSTLDLDTGGGEFDLLGGTLHVGLVEGNLANDGGTISPGGSPGLTTIDGRYQHGNDAVLFIEIAGTIPVTEHDVLSILGDAQLNGGALEVVLDNGFTPQLGHSFEILTAAQGRIGTFQEKLPGLPGALEMQVVYTANEVTLYVVPSITGDYNGNGTVDAADYAVWRNMLGQTGPGLGADGNGDDAIDKFDYDVWRTNFGRTSGSGSTDALNFAVPEPTTGLMTMALLIGSFMTYRRRIICEKSSRPA